jgi:glyoxylase-like metal-dependent hydrolase (beta-lactamase superfamily II)
MASYNRRTLIEGALCGAAACSLPRFALGRTEPAKLSVSRLGTDIIIVAGAGANVVAAADDDGIVMVDGGRAEHSAAVIDTVRRAFDGRPVRSLFNTHWHPAQTGANLALARAGARIVAQANTRLWLGTDVHRPWEKFVHRALPAEARPKVTFYDSGEAVQLKGKALKYGYLLQAHTDGDAYVFFPEANVLACGGVVAGDRWPLIDWWTGGWFGGLVEGTETLLQIADENTRIVPADGPVMTRAQLKAQRDMYAELFLHFRDKLLFKGLSPAEAVAARPTAAFHPEWANRDDFVKLAFQSLWGFYAPDV